MAKKIGVLVELDYCVGCSACQLACQDYYDLPVTETYMRVFLGKPDVVDGRHEMFIAVRGPSRQVRELSRERRRGSLRGNLHLQGAACR